MGKSKKYPTNASIYQDHGYVELGNAYASRASTSSGCQYTSKKKCADIPYLMVDELHIDESLNKIIKTLLIKAWKMGRQSAIRDIQVADDFNDLEIEMDVDTILK